MKNDRNRIQRDAADRNPAAHDENRDPISDTPGAHSVGMGVGAAVGLPAGAVAEQVDSRAEDTYWREEHVNRPYNHEGGPYESFAAAYRTGYEGFDRYPGQTFEEAESDLQRDYETNRGNSDLTWEQAKEATRDAWNRVKDIVSPDDTHHNSR